MIEIMRFRLAAGVDEEAFKRADGHVQSDFAYHNRVAAADDRRSHAGAGSSSICGNRNPTPTRGDDGASDPVTARFMSLVDPTTVETERYDTLD